MSKAEEIATKVDVRDCQDSEDCDICTHRYREVLKAINEALEWAAQQCEEKETVEYAKRDVNYNQALSECADAIRAGKSV